MDHHFNDEQKVSILTSALDERYASMRAIRDRTQSVCVWALGIMLAAGGWLMQSDVTIIPFQKLVYIVGIVVAFAALRFNFLADLYKGFQSQQRAGVRIEKALGMFIPKVFDDEESSIYPESWKSAGAADGEGKFFASTYLLLYIGTAFLLLAVLVHAVPQHHYSIFKGFCPYHPSHLNLH
jgi:hypothetical protein